MTRAPFLLINSSHKIASLLAVGLLLFTSALAIHGFPGLLPYYLDPDEPHFYLAAAEIRLTGRVQINALYPPLRTYQMAMEQWLLDWISGGKASTKVYGVFARAGSAYAGLVVLALVYRIGKRLHSPLAGLLAASLLAFDLQLIIFSHVARGDTWSWAFTAGVILTTIGLIRVERKRLWFAIALFSLCAFLSKYSAAPIWLLPGYLLLRRLFPHPSVQLTIVAMGLVLAAGMVLVIQANAESLAEPLRRTGFVFLVAEDFNFASTLQQSLANFRAGLGDGWFYTGLLIFPALLIWRNELTRRRAAMILILLWAVSFGTAAVFSLTIARYHDAYTVAIIWAIIGGWGLAIFAKQFGKAGLIVAIVWVTAINLPRIASAWEYGEQYTSPHALASLGDWFIDKVPQGARVVVERSTPFNSYAGFPGRLIYHQYTVETLFTENLEAYRERGYEYVVWSSKGFHDSQYFEPQTLAIQPYFTDAIEVARWLPPEYRNPGIVVFQLSPLQQHPLYTWFTPAISFRGYDLNGDTFRPGDEVQLMLYWMSAERVPNNYIVFIHIINTETGQLAAGQDGPPDYGNTPTYEWRADMDFIRDQRIFNLPIDIPEGTYALRVGMYDADTKARVQILDLEYQPVGDFIELQEITVRP